MSALKRRGYPVERRAAALAGLGGAEVAVPECRVGVGFPLELLDPPQRFHGGGRMHVIQERGRPGESLVPDELLRVDPAPGLPERDVPLAGDLAQRLVERHLDSVFSV